MSVNTRPLATSAFAPSVETTLHQSGTGTHTIIDKFTAYNGDAVARTLTVKLVNSGGSAATSNVIVVKALAAGETYTFPEIVGHTLEPGGFISQIATAASVIVVRVSGRQVT